MENDFLQSISRILQRDLELLEKEIGLYPGESLIWKTGGAISNSTGNLCLHLCGNLQHYIGAVLGNSGYARNREHEFAARNLPRQELLDQVRQTRAIIETTLSQLDHNQLEKEYPHQVFGYPMTTTYFLIHLAAHLNYHLGQVNYHRRLLAVS